MLTAKNAILLACAATVFIVAMLIFGDAVVYSNEASYLISSKRLLDPAFLAHDWEVGVRSSGAITSLLFDLAAAPFWLVFGEPASTALALRIALIVLIVFCLFRVIDSLNVPVVPAAIGLVVWLLFGQSIAAGAWIIGGAEKKVLAYAFVLLSISFGLKQRFGIAGFLAGMAVASHVLVGCWYGLAALAAVAVSQRTITGATLRFALAAALPAIPVMVAAVLFAGQGGDATAWYLGKSTAELIVAHRNPHHGDPLLFLNFRQSVEAVCYFGAAIAGMLLLDIERSQRRFMLTLLAGLAVFWFIGLAARWLDIYAVLLLFPFRLGDVLVPMFAAIAGLTAAMAAFSRIARGHRLKEKAPALGMLAVLGLAALLFLDSASGRTPKMLQNRLASWTAQQEGSLPARTGISVWLSENTTPDRVVLAPPLAHWFKIEAARPVVASFKGAPGNAAIHEWFRRMEVLTGTRPIERVGYDMIDWAETAYASLSPAQLAAARREFCADYYLVGSERAEFGDAVVVESGNWHLYSIAEIAPGSAPQRDDCGSAN